MGGDPQQQQQGDLLNLGQSAVPSQLAGDTSGILGALPPQRENNQMNTVTTPEAIQPQLPVKRDYESGALGALGPVPQQSQGMALFSPLNQFMLANSGQNPLLNNMPGMNMGMMPNRFGRF